MKTRAIIIVLSLTATLGCTLSRVDFSNAEVAPESLLSGEALNLDNQVLQLVQDDEVLALSDEMRAFLDTYVDRQATDFLRLNQLVYALISEGTFGLEYDNITRTAAQTFAERRGNCLSFSNLFVAMARDIGLDVSFQEVDVPPDWTYENQTYVLNRHVNVYINLGITGEHIVDFNIEDFRASYDMRLISDERALAHHFNNLGAQYLQENDIATALAYFRKALAHDPQFSPAWTNLGTLYLREDLGRHAETAYLLALEADHLDTVAMSSLAALYQRSGRSEEAALLRKKVANHRKQNPYYRYHLAREAFFARDYQTALDHLRYAVRKKPNEDQFAFMLGLIHLQIGEEKAARRWMERAEKVASSERLKRNYSSKIEHLMEAVKREQ